MFNNFVQKEINRGNSLEALDLYRGLTLATLLETLESNTPFSLRLQNALRTLRTSTEDDRETRTSTSSRTRRVCRKNCREASEWFREVMSTIDRKKIEELVKNSYGLAR